MKKIMILLLCIVLTASGCGSDVDNATNENSLQASPNDSENQENSDNINNAVSDQGSVDIHNTSQVMAAFYALYLEDVEDDNIQERDFIDK